LKPEPVVEEEDTHVVAAADLGKSREDTTRPPTSKDEESTSNDQENPVEEDTTAMSVDLKPETSTADQQDADLESVMLSLDDQKHGTLELPGYLVFNGCAICLDTYKAGEFVVWSSNTECQHAFHRDCILDCFVNLKDDDMTPCPCCRQDFVRVVQPVNKLYAS
jgi:hypothetical protein